MIKREVEMFFHSNLKIMFRISVFVILLISEVSCSDTSAPSNIEQITKPTIMTEKTIVSVDEWLVSNLPIRDVYLRDGFAIFSNSAPEYMRSEFDGEPYITYFDTINNHIAWSHNYEPIAPISVNSHYAYIVETSQLIAVGLEGGDEKWHIPFDTQGFAQVYADDELVLIGEKDAISAFNANNGNLLWKEDLPGNIDIYMPHQFSFNGWRENSALVKHDHNVYVRILNDAFSDNGCSPTTLIVMDSISGEKKWLYSLGKAINNECIAGTFPLSFSDNLVLVSTFDHPFKSCFLKALDEGDGQIIWDYSIIDGCSSDTRAIFINNTFIIVTRNKLYTINSRDGKLIPNRTEISGDNNKMISTYGIIIGNLKTTSDGKIYRTIDLRTGGTFNVIETPLPEICESPSLQILGFHDWIAFVRDRCIQIVNLTIEKND